ncbi:hypothetical protein [Pseudomonas paralcaligenes]|uniref:hypothetical protein n=1 Tax=Pseudomonas paralcaligenes TaxID=2772558 RepID=UPI001C7FBD9B|nr:hypothetical protein [Pseudomonas paralcaligenes]
MWLHPIALTTTTTLALFGSLHIASDIIQLIPSIFSKAEQINSLIAPSVIALSKILPGLLLGWLTKRQPLIYAAIAGAIGALPYMLSLNVSYEIFSKAGRMLEAGIIVSISALSMYKMRKKPAPLISNSNRPTRSLGTG